MDSEVFPLFSNYSEPAKVISIGGFLPAILGNY